MILILIFTLFLCLYYLGMKNFDYWKNRGIKHEKPIPFFGNNMKNFLMQRSVAETITDVYKKWPNERVVGYFRGTSLQLVLRDPEIIKRVLVNDFSYFHRRGLNFNRTHIEPLRRNVFFADGDLWRQLRYRMTPSFTSGKLRNMFPLIQERAEKLQELILERQGNTLDARDLMARYTTDFIGACAFGLDSDSLSDESSAFRKLGVRMFSPGVKDILVNIMKELFPNLSKHLRYFARFEKDFLNLTNCILKERSYKPSGRNDFVDLLLEAKEKGEIVCDSIEKPRKSDGTPQQATLEFTDELIASQIFIFFAAGFETSSSATSFTLHQLAFNADIQEKAQKEIDTVLAKYNNKLCYDAIKEMRYLEWTFKEGMRMFPSLGFLSRECEKSYTIPELDLQLSAGVRVIIPVQALHMDPKYFPDPHLFKPERFDSESTIQEKFVYLPFGEGPRACIGERLGMMQSLAGLAAVLSVCTVQPASTTRFTPIVNPKSTIVQTVAGGLPLQFVPRIKPSA